MVILYMVNIEKPRANPFTFDAKKTRLKFSYLKKIHYGERSNTLRGFVIFDLLLCL